MVSGEFKLIFVYDALEVMTVYSYVPNIIV